MEKVLHRVLDAEEIAQQRAAVLDVKESFECGREDDLLQPNIWLPDGILPGFKEACLDFYWVCAVSHNCAKVAKYPYWPVSRIVAKRSWTSFVL